MLSRLENDVLGNAMGLETLDGALTRTTGVWCVGASFRLPLQTIDFIAKSNQKTIFCYSKHNEESLFLSSQDSSLPLRSVQNDMNIHGLLTVTSN